MNILLDSCVWGGVKKVLDSRGYDSRWIGDLLKDPGDESVLHIAYIENRVLITLDKDFGELAIVRGKPHRGIIRLVGFSVLQQGDICVKIIQKYNKDLNNGAIITVEKTKVRIRPPD